MSRSEARYPVIPDCVESVRTIRMNGHSFKMVAVNGFPDDEMHLVDHDGACVGKFVNVKWDGT